MAKKESPPGVGVARRQEGKGLEARIKAVEEAIGPLITQVSRPTHPKKIIVFYVATVPT